MNERVSKGSADLFSEGTSTAYVGHGRGVGAVLKRLGRETQRLEQGLLLRT
jgi:hypothetical protein